MLTSSQTSQEKLGYNVELKGPGAVARLHGTGSVQKGTKMIGSNPFWVLVDRRCSPMLIMFSNRSHAHTYEMQHACLS